ncbi:AMP-binding protein [soil metagenome]
MDVTSLLTVAPAPAAVFSRLPTHRDKPRFHVRDPAGAWQPVTWGQFAIQIRGVARWLVDHDVAVGDRVAIFAANSVAWASAALGAQTAGAVFVPIYPASTADQVAYILGHAEIKHVFVAGTELASRLDHAIGLLREGQLANKPQIIDLDSCAWTLDATVPDPHSVQAAARRDAEAPAIVDARLHALELDQPAEMLYTSGTSGNPKGVPLSHRNVGSNGRDWLESNAARLEEGDRDLLWLPLSHIFGWGELCAGNLLAWETYLATPADALALLPVIAPHVFMSVPAYWEKIARLVSSHADREAALKAVTGGKLRFCLSGGAGLKVDIKQQLHAHGLLIIEGYGLTETSPTLTLNKPEAYRFDTVGKPFPSVELRLDHDGEILARGDNVFKGYFKDPDATQAAFTDDGWFRTGDVGRWTHDGFLQIIDRKKDILVTAGGKNVPPANIEARFVDDPVIERLVVYGEARSYLVAAIWTRAEVPASERDQLVAQRVEAINGELARYESIKKFFIADAPLSVEDGTLTSSLKLRRKAVYDRLRGRFEALYA